MTNRPGQDAPAWYKPGEAASRLGITPRTVARLATLGRIGAITLPSGHRRYSATDVDAMAEAGKTVAA